MAATIINIHNLSKMWMHEIKYHYLQYISMAKKELHWYKYKKIEAMFLYL